jgi:flagellar hook-associated protein 2
MTITTTTPTSSVTAGSTTASSTSSTTTSTGATSTSTLNTTGGGATYLTGTASGLNTQALINAAMQQYLEPATQLQAQVTANQTKIAAYQQLQSLISGLTTSMSKLASQTFSVLNTGGSDFLNKSATVTASDGSTASNYVSITAAQSATVSNYTLEVNQLAEAQKVASTAMSQSTALGYAGSFTLSDASGTPQTITVTSSMTLNDVATAINNVSASSGVSASIIKDSSGQYRLVLSANDTNQSISTSVTSGQDVLNAMGLTDSTGAFANVIQAAQPAKVTVDGQQITSDTDDITDAVSGLDIQLNNATPTNVTLNVKVASDPSAVQTDLNNFIIAYNSLRSFVTANQQVNSDGTVSSSAPLFADSLLTGASQMLNGLLATPSASSSGSIRTLADIGITLDANNNLQISNQSALTSALQNNLSQVASMFQTTYAPSDSGLKLMQNSTSTAFNFTLTVTANANGTLTGASVNGDSSMFSISGNLITGNAGTPYAGLSFAYHTSAASTAIQVSIQPGLANQIKSFASMYADSVTGLIQQTITSLDNQDTDWNSRITQIQQQSQDYQTQLINKYALMEQQVQAQQLIQQQIKAIMQSQYSSNN